MNKLMNYSLRAYSSIYLQFIYELQFRIFSFSVFTNFPGLNVHVVVRLMNILTTTNIPQQTNIEYSYLVYSFQS